MKLRTKLMVSIPLAVVVAYCGSESVTVPDMKNVTPTIAPAVLGAPTVVSPSPTPDPRENRSYITFGAGCAGTWCAVKGSANRVSIISTVPLKNDAKSIYGEWFVRADTGQCVDFPRAEEFIKFPGCGDIPVQCDASLGYGGGAHAGHVITTVRAILNCPDPSPTPSPDPTPTPCIEEWTEQTPIITYSEWGECHIPEVTTSRHEDPPTCTGIQTRLVTTVINEINSCTKATRIKSTTVTTETQSCPLTCPGTCFYNVPGRDGKIKCMLQPGFVSWNEQNHLCELAFPGVCNSHFNLNPGQSDECLKKTDCTE